MAIRAPSELITGLFVYYHHVYAFISSNLIWEVVSWKTSIQLFYGQSDLSGVPCCSHYFVFYLATFMSSNKSSSAAAEYLDFFSSLCHIGCCRSQLQLQLQHTNIWTSEHQKVIWHPAWGMFWLKAGPHSCGANYQFGGFLTDLKKIIFKSDFKHFEVVYCQLY